MLENKIIMESERTMKPLTEGEIFLVIVSCVVFISFFLIPFCMDVKEDWDEKKHIEEMEEHILKIRTGEAFELEYKVEYENKIPYILIGEENKTRINSTLNDDYRWVFSINSTVIEDNLPINISDNLQQPN